MKLEDLIANIRASYTAEEDSAKAPAKAPAKARVKVAKAPPTPTLTRVPSAQDARSFLDAIRAAGKRVARDADGNAVFYANDEPKIVVDPKAQNGDEREALSLYFGQSGHHDQHHKMLVSFAITRARTVIEVSEGKLDLEASAPERDWTAPAGVPDRERIAYQLRDAEITLAVEAERGGDKARADRHLENADKFNPHLSR